MNTSPPIPHNPQSTQLLNTLQSGQIYIVKGSKGSGFILCHPYYSEVVGLGALVGGAIDINCHRVIPIGEPCLVHPESSEQRHLGYRIRNRWMQLMERLIESSAPIKRSKNIMMMLELNFDCDSLAQLSDEVLARMAAVLPTTIAIAREDRTTDSPSQESFPQSAYSCATVF